MLHGASSGVDGSERAPPGGRRCTWRETGQWKQGCWPGHLLCRGSDQLASRVWGLQDSAEVSRGCVPSWSGTRMSTETPGGSDEITAWATQIQKCGTKPSPRDQDNRWPLSGVGKAVTLLVSFI